MAATVSAFEAWCLEVLGELPQSCSADRAAARLLWKEQTGALRQATQAWRSAKWEKGGGTLG